MWIDNSFLFPNIPKCCKYHLNIIVKEHPLKLSFLKQIIHTQSCYFLLYFIVGKYSCISLNSIWYDYLFSLTTRHSLIKESLENEKAFTVHVHIFILNLIKSILSDTQLFTKLLILAKKLIFILFALNTASTFTFSNLFCLILSSEAKN